MVSYHGEGLGKMETRFVNQMAGEEERQFGFPLSLFPSFIYHTLGLGGGEEEMRAACYTP